MDLEFIALDKVGEEAKWLRLFIEDMAETNAKNMHSL